jgi:hypothetical protein
MKRGKRYRNKLHYAEIITGTHAGICNRVPVWSSPLVEKAVNAVGYQRICETDNEDVVRAHFFKAL